MPKALRAVSTRTSPTATIAGVLVRDTGWLEPAGWDAADHAYMQAELRAVTLAWLAGLTCPVINRPDAALWYRAGAPLFAWRALLRGCGLPLPEVVVTSDPAEARAFRCRLARDGVAGAVYTPLTAAAGYLLADDDAWERLATLQARAPVCLTEPHGAAVARLHRRRRGDLGRRGATRGGRPRTGAVALCRSRRISPLSRSPSRPFEAASPW